MSDFMRRLADKLLVAPASYVIRSLGYRDEVRTRLNARAIEDSTDFYLERMPQALVFKDRYPLFDLSLRTASIDGLTLEFGSFRGKSLRYLGPRVQGTIHGFDSFEGLKEDWAGASAKGAFDVGGQLPSVPSNVELHKGWFDATLPPFLAAHPGPVRFLHLDADTYESTAYVLDQLEERIVPGTVIQFDEYFGYNGWRFGEYKAFEEFIERTGRTFTYLGIGWMSVAVRIDR